MNVPEPSQGRTWTVVLPAGLGLLNANDRLHHHVKARLTAALRLAGRQAALAAEVPAIERAHIIGRYCPPDRRRRDVGNLYPSFKAAIDGLVDAGVLPDDDDEHLIGPDMRLGPVVACGRLELVVTELAAPGRP
ncbi:hypothetical protein Ssi03_25540 [Sphaerisporangium siamense]|uniref:Uncharacterized protein n=1 Tax=Sphaerisporangium siamense TaxID=795645 RepID=A0A7W7GAL2_9ACTN|nr:hypothetical protein [Sphaerisporangium siamense]MBB4700121.1 hypothetical protein [Sphaerisporangium siamense]GII84564.1 hypothetical protein Ssi03_25540 [Sphaerisporangium siamense]